MSAKSTKKDYVFDFLTKVYTDTKLSNLLLFGIEDKDYKIIDGIIPFSEAKFDMNNWLVYGNSFIATPLEYEFKNKTELYMELHNKAELNPLCRFVFDESKVKNIVTQTDGCMEKLERIFNEDADFDEVLNSIRQDLYANNVQTLIDEVDAQVSELLNHQQ